MWGTEEMDLSDVKNVDMLSGLFLITQLLTVDQAQRDCAKREKKS